MMAFSATEQKAAFGLASVFSIRMLGLFMIMPVFAIYGAQLEGFSPFWMGLAIGIYGLTQACLQIPMGYLSDRIGRKPVIYAGLIVFALGSVLAATAEHIIWVTVGRALQGAGAISSAVLALAADLSRDHQRPKVMAIIGLFIGLSFMVALVLGPVIAKPFGLAGLFWLTAALAVIALLVVKFMVPNAIYKAPAGDTLVSWSKVKQLTHNSQLWRLSLGVLVLHFCMTSLFTLLPAQLLDEGGVDAIWHVLLPVLLISFLLLGAMMRLNRKGKVHFGLLLSACLMLLGVVAFAQVSNFSGLLLALLLFFTGFNYLEACLPGLVAQVAPAGQKGSAMGLFASCQFGGAFLGGMTAGSLLQWFNPIAVWGCMTLLLLLWLLFAWSLKVNAALKSVQLYVPEPHAGNGWLADLAQQPGVAEAVYIADEKVVYLKVDLTQFDRAAAEILLQSH